jgi:ribosomal protein S18 acetylase RimI-like enzyme
MKIRKATLEDAGILSALNADVQRLHADALPHLFKQPKNGSFALQFMREQLSDPCNYFFIVNLDGEDIGYIFARVEDRPENPYTHAWHYVYIDQISVKPAYQKMGCGKRLIEEVVRLAKEVGADWIALDTWAFNEGAISFFKKQGFVTFNQRMWLVGQ